jgi:uncharacterized protein YbaA (DUF1428 family)
MSKSNVVEMEKEIGSQVQLFIWRIPKKNHDAMVHLQKQFNDLWRKHGGLRTEVFQLANTETYEGCTNIANTVSAGPDEEIWIELQAFRDRQHMDEVVTKLMNDESMLRKSTFETVYGTRHLKIRPNHGEVQPPQNLEMYNIANKVKRGELAC